VDNLTPVQREFLEDTLIAVDLDSDLPPQMAHFKKVLHKFPEEQFVIYNDEGTPPILVARSRYTTIFRCTKCKKLDGPLVCPVCHSKDIQTFKLSNETWED
jgi:hypothetical protein